MHRSIMCAVLCLALMLTSGSSMRVFSSLCASGGSPILPLSSDESCKDGVCSLPTSKVGIIGSNEAPIYNNKGAGIAQQEKDLKIQQLVGMGWEEAAANRSLTAADFDVDKAAMMLDEEEKEREENEVLIKELSKMGNWTLEAAESAFLQSSKNITAASALLEHEEGIIAQNFDTAVKDMMANGWEELVARQALFTQWTLDQRKALGLNTTIDPEVLASIRPTLKIREDGKSSSASSSSSSSKKNKKAKEAPVKEAKREDCVFECKAQDFQRLVLDSDVPVLVDVYADWCGPCKQLGPVLENAAMKSGGMFRLVKINSDQQRELSETLGVSGLPTVFAVVGGKVTDRFVGMLPQEELQQFIVRAVTGYGGRVQEEQISNAELDAMTRKLANFAGLTSLSFKKLSLLKSKVDAILTEEDAFKEDGSPEDGLVKAMKIVKNAHADIRVYTNSLSSSVAATKLLDLAGFKHEEGGAKLQLVHSNPAILSVILQRLGEGIQRKKNEKMTKTSSRSSSNPPQSKKMTYALKNDVDKKQLGNAKKDIVSRQSIYSKQEEENETKSASRKSVKTAADSVEVAVRLGGKEEVRRKSLPLSATLEEAVTALLGDDSDWKTFEIRYPNPRRIISRNSMEMKYTLSKVCDVKKEDLFRRPSLSLYVESPNNVEGGKRRKGFGAMFGTGMKQRSGGTHTLLSVNPAAKSKKNNEYFGGDSTVTLAGEEDEEEPARDDEESEEADDESH